MKKKILIGTSLLAIFILLSPSILVTASTQTTIITKKTIETKFAIIQNNINKEKLSLIKTSYSTGVDGILINSLLVLLLRLFIKLFLYLLNWNWFVKLIIFIENLMYYHSVHTTK